MHRGVFAWAAAVVLVFTACSPAEPRAAQAGANSPGRLVSSGAVGAALPPNAEAEYTPVLTSTPVPITHDAAGVPLPVAMGARISRIVTYTPIPTLPPGTTPVPQILSGQVKVDAGDQYFIPSDLTVTVGTTLAWTNVGADEHDVVARDGSFNSKSLSPGNQFSFTFAVPGTYDYICTFHYGNGMFGSVKVVDSGAPQAPASD
jgi:plastocyanin